MTPTVTHARALAASAAVSLTGAGTRLQSVAARLKARPAAVRSPVLAAAVLLLTLRPAAAQAQGGTGSLDSFLTNVVNLLTGSTGQAIAIIAVALCGLGAMFGALSARAFGGVVLGVAIVFSSAWIVQKITGGA